MKKLKIILISLIITAFLSPVLTSQAATLDDYLEKKSIPSKISNAIANLDINFGFKLANIDPIDGANLSGKYNYEVEASYLNKFYTRMDKWDIQTAINVGEILKDTLDLPFSFSVNRNSSFIFVRQFQKKKEAATALPYSLKNLPLNATQALLLESGDFVSMPANLNVAVSLQASTTLISPVIVAANAGVYFVLSGEFMVQVFKLDETHVRLKLMTKEERDLSGKANIGLSFDIFGVRVLDHQIDRFFERDLFQFGKMYTPGSQFIVDYIFDLKNMDAQEAYNQILSSTFKFKDFAIANVLDGSNLKDKIISSYEKAEAIFEADKNLEPKDRRVQRIFKGFNNYQAHTQHWKFSFFIASYTKDRTYSESKLTFIDKKENNLEFFYPTFTKYTESNYGKWGFSSKDQSIQTNFGLNFKLNLEDSKTKNPDLGLIFERKDQYLKASEQKKVKKFLLTQIPADLAKDIDLSIWSDGQEKIDSRINFHLAIKFQGFGYLKNISIEEMKQRLLDYITEKEMMDFKDTTHTNILFLNNIKNYFKIQSSKKEAVLSLADSLTQILKIENSEKMLKELLGLNKIEIFENFGMGFLISLLPENKLIDLVYMKLEIISKDLEPVIANFGSQNFHVLYNQLGQIQARLSNRNYDLRITHEDLNMENLDTEYPANESISVK